MKKTPLLVALTALALSLGTALVAAPTALAQSSTSTSQTAVSFPINLNTASDAEILAVPTTGQRFLREFKEYRPYVNVEQFRRELGKYVDPAQVNAWLQYVFVPTNPNTATAAQLTALKGVDQAMADYIVANRSYKDWNALKAALTRKYGAAEAAKLERYWVFG